jgi:uncharacterized protein (DUF427 family)
VRVHPPPANPASHQADQRVFAGGAVGGCRGGVDGLGGDEVSRHVEIRVHHELLASTHRPTLVVETGLPPRWYVPPGDVRWDRLTPSPLHTVCQYKGTAHYWTIDHTDPPTTVWSYPEPLPETAALAGLISIIPEHPAVELRVDTEP